MVRVQFPLISHLECSIPETFLPVDVFMWHLSWVRLQPQLVSFPVMPQLNSSELLNANSYIHELLHNTTMLQIADSIILLAFFFFFLF